MNLRHYFHEQLNELRDEILLMGSRVREELRMALDALATLNPEKAQAVFAADVVVNGMRFRVEEKCFTLIVTQQPAGSDMRNIMAAMSVIVDLERMGDQAKGIAKVVPHLLRNPPQERPPELQEMGEVVGQMLDDALLAYARNDVQLATDVAGRDDRVDRLYSQVFNKALAADGRVGHDGAGGIGVRDAARGVRTGTLRRSGDQCGRTHHLPGDGHPPRDQCGCAGGRLEAKRKRRSRLESSCLVKQGNS